MARFYGAVQGQRGRASRLGGRASGLVTVAAGWGGSVRVDVSEREGRDWCVVTLEPWHGSGGARRVLYAGPLNAGAILSGGSLAGELPAEKIAG